MTSILPESPAGQAARNLERWRKSDMDHTALDADVDPDRYDVSRRIRYDLRNQIFEHL